MNFISVKKKYDALFGFKLKVFQPVWLAMQAFKNAQKVQGIPLLDRAFHYGDGCFTTARIQNNQITLKDRHWTRLQRACQQLQLQADLAVIEQTLQILQQHAKLNGTLKIVISRGEGNRGYALPDHPADIYVFYYPQGGEGSIQPESIESGTLQQRMGLTMPNLVGIKTLNRLEQVMFKQEAQQKGWVEAIVADVQGQVVEGVSSNCFIHLDNNCWITPELRYNGVHGVMRAEILARMQQAGITCEQRALALTELKQTSSLFFCNALSPMKMVTRLNDRSLQIQPCQELFQILQLDQI